MTLGHQPLGVSPRFNNQPDANAFRLIWPESKSCRPEQAAGEMVVLSPDVTAAPFRH